MEKGKEGYSSLWNHLTATRNHIPYGMVCVLPATGRGDFPAFTAAEAGIQFSYPEKMQS